MNKIFIREVKFYSYKNNSKLIEHNYIVLYYVI